MEKRRKRKKNDYIHIGKCGVIYILYSCFHSHKKLDEGNLVSVLLCYSCTDHIGRGSN